MDLRTQVHRNILDRVPAWLWEVRREKEPPKKWYFKHFQKQVGWGTWLEYSKVQQMPPKRWRNLPVHKSEMWSWQILVKKIKKSNSVWLPKVRRGPCLGYPHNGLFPWLFPFPYMKRILHLVPVKIIILYNSWKIDIITLLRPLTANL